MASVRLALRLARPSMVPFSRPFSTACRFMATPGNSTTHANIEGHRKAQKEKSLGPRITNTDSTLSSKITSAGEKNTPPEFLTDTDNNAELAVGEMEGGSFRVEPLRRVGEDANTMRARLVYQSRKRGTLESDLLMSTFADAHLDKMSIAQMAQYDLFLDENDWDIYYWATQEAEDPGASLEGTASGSQTGSEPETDAWRQGKARSGEWAQTIGTFKPAYRPVPARWKNSEVLAMLRKHVISRSAGGVHNDESEVKTSGGGMAFMPKVRNMDV